MAEKSERERLDELSNRIGRAEAERRAKRSQSAGANPVMLDVRKTIGATRIGADFVAAIIGGAILGWGFDLGFGTQPWGLLGFLFGGFAVGFVNVVRILNRSGTEAAQKEKDDPHGDSLTD
jgi:ATP synthase protein I